MANKHFCSKQINVCRKAAFSGIDSEVVGEANRLLLAWIKLLCVLEHEFKKHHWH